MDILSNDWLAWVGNHYSIAIGLGLGILKLVAILHPKIPTNALFDLVSQAFFKAPVIKASMEELSEKDGKTD